MKKTVKGHTLHHIMYDILVYLYVILNKPITYWQCNCSTETSYFCYVMCFLNGSLWISYWLVAETINICIHCKISIKCSFNITWALMCLEVPATRRFVQQLLWVYNKCRSSAVVTLYEGNPTATSGFPKQRASNSCHHIHIPFYVFWPLISASQLLTGYCCWN